MGIILDMRNEMGLFEPSTWRTNPNVSKEQIEQLAKQGAEHEDNLRPYLFSIPRGLDLVDLLEDFNRKLEGLAPKHGGDVIYNTETRSFERSGGSKPTS